MLSRTSVRLILGMRLGFVGLAESLPRAVHVDVFVFGPLLCERPFQLCDWLGLVYDLLEFLVGVVLGMLLCVEETLDFLFIGIVHGLGVLTFFFNTLTMCDRCFHTAIRLVPVSAQMAL